MIGITNSFFFSIIHSINSIVLRRYQLIFVHKMLNSRTCNNLKGSSFSLNICEIEDFKLKTKNYGKRINEIKF